ncbi:MAG: chromate transporter [Clostridiales bacterium]|nr:chromate transporter [Clostridiales bacterium]
MKILFEMFFAFAGVGALTFGGGYTMLPLLQKKIAARHGWATDEEIMDYYAIAQGLPGIIAVNTAMLIGHKRKGFPGQIAAALGMAAPSVVVILMIAMFIQNFLHLEWVRHAFAGVRVAVLALITDATVKLWQNGVKDLTGIIIFVIAVLAFTLTPVSPAAPLLAGAVCGIVIKERKKKKR